MSLKKKPKVREKTREAVRYGGVIFIMILLAFIIYEFQGVSDYWDETRTERETCNKCLVYLGDLAAKGIIFAVLLCGLIVSIVGILKLGE